MSDFSVTTLRPGHFLRTTAGLALVGAAALTTACGTSDDTRKRLAAVQEQLTVMQNTNDRLEDRVAALELAGARKPAAAARGSEAGLLARPPLKVVKVDPTSSSATPNADEAPAAASDAAPTPVAQDEDDAARPLIRGSGDKLEARNVATPATAGKNSPRAKAGAVGQTH
jgi:hypothetical protein